ncbi:MAG: hypothetical protein KatS3mg023_1170 [Armatimonadota bacterium]|nr:MAG: hypothetical protein KatS3mg023_1170 [Armatimonadota bacterium]
MQNPSAVNADMEVPYRLRLGDAQGEVLVSGSLRVPARGEATTTEWVWSPQLSAGRYNLYLEIDPENAIEESDEGNNTAQSEVALSADLLVNPALTWLEHGTGGQATVHTAIQNNGWAEARNVVVQVRTAVEGGTVLAGATIERLGRYEVSSLSLPISLSQAGSAVWVIVNPDGTIDEVRRDNNTVGLQVAARTYSVSGQVELQDYQGDVTTVPVVVQVRQNGNVVRTEVLSLDAQGGYILYHLAPGTYELAFKASHWLRRVRTVEVVSSDVLGVSVSLINGDVDGDNEVSLFDFGALVAAFGSAPGDANWNADADLDGDQEVSLFDFGILVRHFGEIGDE